MYIREITKDTLFIRLVGNEEENMYFVNEEYTNGFRCITTTKDPYKAKIFTTKEAYDYTYNHLNYKGKKDIISAHKDNTIWYSLTNRVANLFRVLTVDEIECGYTGDAAAETKLLETLDIKYMITEPQVTELGDDDTDAI